MDTARGAIGNAAGASLALTSRRERVRNRFDKTERYLGKDFGISVRVAVVRDLLGELSHSTILDLGCGDGRLSLQYVSSTNSLTLVDLSNRMLEIARANTPLEYRHRVNYVHTDLDQYAPTSRFDVVLCVGVLAHVVSVAETISRIGGLLKPGGRCVLQITDSDRWSGAALRLFYGMRHVFRPAARYALTRTSFEALAPMARANGLELRATRQYWSPAPGMGAIPNRWLWKYQMFTLSHASLSRAGSERVLLYAKAG